MLAAHRGAADAAGTDCQAAVYRKIEAEIQANRGLTVKRMVQGGVIYRFDEEYSPKVDRDMDLRDAIQRIALKWPSYGRPRNTAELKRQGWKVGPNRVRRIMREDRLDAIVYPYLLPSQRMLLTRAALLNPGLGPRRLCVIKPKT